MPGVTYDTGALIAAESNDRRCGYCMPGSSPKKSSRLCPHQCSPKRGGAAHAKPASRGSWHFARSRPSPNDKPKQPVHSPAEQTTTTSSTSPLLSKAPILSRAVQLECG